MAFALQQQNYRPKLKPQKVFAVTINGQKLNILARSSMDAISRAMELVADETTPAEGLIISVRPL